jgi:two-component system response regulator HydG
VIAGVFAADPGLDLEKHLRLLRDLGVAGVTNWPSLGFIDGIFAEALREEGVHPAGEIEMLKAARRVGLAAVGFVHGPEQAAHFAPYSDGMILNLGLTRHVRDLSDRRDQVQQAIVRLNRMLAGIQQLKPHPLCLAFGGPLTFPEDLQQLARQCRIDGFAGGSVFERLPVQEIVESTVRRFHTVRLQTTDADEPESATEMIGATACMRQLWNTIRRAAPYDVSVCIEGESGTGKELVAAHIHRFSPRAHESLVTLNCGAIPETLLESELFGHEKGAFTGAHRRRLGKFELAHRGTLFLDEVADLSPRGQVSLLRALQQREITRVGGEQPIRVDVRVLAASHQCLATAVREGRFRADLYYRLNQLTIRVPPLRERLEDIPALAEAIVGRLRTEVNRPLLGLSDRFHQRLRAYDWPGNVRELEHVISRAAILEDSPVLEGDSFVPAAPPASDLDSVTARPNPHARRAGLVEALRRAGGNKSKAAAELGISRKTLYAWLKEVRS